MSGVRATIKITFDYHAMQIVFPPAVYLLIHVLVCTIPERPSSVSN